MLYKTQNNKKCVIPAFLGYFSTKRGQFDAVPKIEHSKRKQRIFFLREKEVQRMELSFSKNRTDANV